MRIVLRVLLAVVLTACGSASPAPRAVARVDPEPAAPAPPAPRDRSRPARLVATDAGYCRADASGSVACWGPSWHYDLEPQHIEGITDAVELASTPGATCARRASGRVTCFSPDRETRSTVVTDIDIDDAVDLAAQYHELCAVRRSGRVVCWGGDYSYHGWRDVEHGPESWAVLTERSEITDAIALRAPEYAGTIEQAGAGHGGWCALRRSGRVTCWGRCNLPGEPRVGDHPINFEIEGIDDVADLSLGPERSCILRRSGSVICTGEAERGSTPLFVVVRPGDPVADAPSLPDGWSPVRAAEGLVELEWRGFGSSTDCARTDAGEVRCWDDESLRALVDTSDAEPTDAADEAEPAGAADEAEAGGPADEADDGLADEAVDEWEQRVEEQRRLGQMPSALLDTVDEVVAYEEGGCASLREGGVQCWGDAYDGLGRDDVVATPQRVGGVSGAVQVRSGESSSCALDHEGRVYCWGVDRANAFSDHDGSLEPVHVDGLDGAEEIALGSMSLCARTARGEVRCRGYIARSSSRSDHPGARPIPSLRGVRGLAVTSGTACGIRSGRVRCYDVDHVYPEDGHGPPRIVTRTITIDGIDGAVDIHPASSGAVWFARTSDGRVAAFVIRHDVSSDPRWLDAPLPGVATMLDGLLCALHEGTFTCGGGPDAHFTPPDPVEVGELTQVSGGRHHACGVRADGEVVCWGLDAYGELGRLPIAQRYAPAAVEGLHDVVQVSAGVTHTCAVTRGGELYCWGREGQLGIVRPSVRARVRTVPGVH